MRKGFWPRVRMAGSCWEWTGPVNSKGYGVISRKVYGEALAHRYAFSLTVGDIPNGACVLHRCDNPRCVNPDHLFTGSKAENNADMMAKGRYARGESNGQSKLTNDLVAQIRSAAGTHASIAAHFSVHQSTVTRIKAGRIWMEAAS